MDFNDIENLSPSEIWHYFKKVCAIPHISGHEQQLSQYLVDFAKANKLEYIIQDCGNVIIKKKSNHVSNKDNCPTVIIQAHIDMVGVHDSEIDFDFLTMPIETEITPDGYVKAKKTTLGADNGIGVACILAILANKFITIPNLIAIFTVAEETSMLGVTQLNPDDLKDATYAINLDTEDMGEICLGCAGSSTYNITYTPRKKFIEQEYDIYKLEINNGLGGHSGLDIDKGQMNVAAELLSVLDETNNEAINIDNKIWCNFMSIKTGTVRNSIPSNGTLYFAIAKENAIKAISMLKEKIHVKVFHYVENKKDPFLSYNIEKIENSDDEIIIDNMYSDEDTLEIVKLMNLNTKVIEYTPHDTPLTSCNLGVIKTDNNGITTFSALARYGNNSGKELIESKIEELCNNINNSNITEKSCYNFWEANYESELAKIATAEYLKLTGRSTKLTEIHAGLECGTLKQLNPNLEIISIGPNIEAPHTINEKVNIDSVGLTHLWLSSILTYIANINQKENNY
jgi:dipeptidase D